MNNDKALAEFTAYFVRNYPGPDTVIHDPNWHAPKLFSAAQRAILGLNMDQAQLSTIDHLAYALARTLWYYFKGDPSSHTDALDWFYRISLEPEPAHVIDLCKIALNAAAGQMNSQRPTGQPLTFGYTNWRGEYGIRSAIPMRVWFGSTEFHSEPQWLLKAWDTEKNAVRDFSLRDIVTLNGGAA